MPASKPRDSVLSTAAKRRNVDDTQVSRGAAAGSTRHSAAAGEPTRRSSRGTAPRGPNRPTPDLARQIYDLCTKHPQGISQRELMAQTGLSRIPLANARKWLDDHGVGVVSRSVGARSKRWFLSDPSSEFPEFLPGPEDLIPLQLALAAVQPFLDDAENDRLQELLTYIDDRITERKLKSPGKGRLDSSAPHFTRLDLTRLKGLLDAIRSGRQLEIDYEKVWEPVAERRVRRYQIRPWALRLHDGVLYLRADAIRLTVLPLEVQSPADTRHQPRTFRVAAIKTVTESQRPHRALRARPPTCWPAGDPTEGVDGDQPGRATIVLLGAVARYVSSLTWHPEQEDQWLTPDERLQRAFPFRSTRDLARRLMPYADAIESLHPSRILNLMHAYASMLPPADDA